MIASRRQLRGRAALPALLATALLMAGCGSSETTSRTAPAGTGQNTAPESSASPTRAAGCDAGRLAIAYAGTEGATGHLEVTLTVRNGSGTTCSLHGYPGARLIDATGRTLPMRVRRGNGFFPDTQQRPRTVVLAPGRQARYGLSFATNNEYRGARKCVTAAALAARLPGSSRWTRVVLAGGGRPRIAPCGPQLVVSPVYVA